MDFIKRYWTCAAFVCAGICLGLRFTLFRHISAGLSGERLGATLCLAGTWLLTIPIVEETRRLGWFSSAPCWAKMMSRYNLSTYGFYFLSLLIYFLFRHSEHVESFILLRAFCGGLALHAICSVTLAKFVQAIFCDGYKEPLKELGGAFAFACMAGAVTGLGSGAAALGAFAVKKIFAG